MKVSFPGLDIDSDDCILIRLEDFGHEDKTAKIIARMNWIDVSEKLPEEFIDVLTCCVSHGRSTEYGLNTYPEDEKYMAIDRLCVWSDGYPPSFRCDRFFGKVIAWMPLPRMPEE